MSDELTPGEKAVISKGSDGLKKAGLEAALTKTRPKYTEIIKEAIKNLGENARRSEIINYALKKHPDYNEATLSAHVNFMTVNVNSRCNYTSNKKPRGFNPEYDVLYKIETGVYTLYDSNKHGLYTIEMGQDGKTHAVKDGKIIGENTESPLLKFVRDEMQMQANYQPIVIKMLLESKGDSSKSTFKQAAITILKQYRNPLHYKKIIKIMLEQNYIETEGETPERTLLTEINREISKNGENSIFKKIDEGVYGLRDYTTESSETVESSFAVSYDDIKKKFDELNFDSERFTEGERNSGSFGSSMDSVKGALEEFVTYDNGATKGGMALKQEQFNHSEIPEILKICGQKIAKWHKKMKGDDFNLYYCSPGSSPSGHEFLPEFEKSSTIGCNYGVPDNLSNYTTEEVRDNYPDGAGENLRQLKRIKPGDIVLCNNGKKGIYDFGIATSEYFFVDEEVGKKNGRYPHRVKVEWLHVGPLLEEEHYYSAANQGCDIIDKHKDKFMNILLDEHEHPEYFLLRHNVDGPWKDDLGKEYHFGKTVANQLKLRSAGVGTKTIWFTKSDGDYYFWGYGIVKRIQTEVEDEKWKLVYDDFKFFKDNLVDIQGRKLKHGSESIKQQIMELPKFNLNTSVFTIPKKLYEEITSDRSHMSSLTISDIPDSVPYAQVLNFNKNLILYGPPGTGKTHKAEEAAEALTKNQGDGNFIRKVTFHPSYSYEDFVEGFRPNVKYDNSQPYVLDDGIFKEICDEAKKDSGNRYVLLIDEINRGNIPKIFGELITVIENGYRGPKNVRALAYSKEKDNFYVPENLYIIGTMNTADKSLVQMDEALRRRFVFEELMPEPDLLEKEDRPGKKYKDILEDINKKIVEGDRIKQFRDRQIGHSYFWKEPFGDKQMRLVIKYQIIPLLQDYFYDDYEEIKRILGNKIIGKDNRPGPILDEGNEKDLITELRRHLSGKSSAESENEEQN